jgi:hypothetical protein
MSAIEPAGEKIVRNLQQAVQRLQDDLARVELWAGALGCFSKPIPDYSHGQTQFDLPSANTKSPNRKSGSSEPRKSASKSASKIGSPARNNAVAGSTGKS